MFPWQKKQWQQLWHSQQIGRLAHALLFAGPAGTGKTQFTTHFIKALLCQQPITNETTFACSNCHVCRLLQGRTHPDVLWIAPEKEGQAIKVDQIREVSEFVSQSALKGNYRIIVIAPAEAMNGNAANALLKTLEEPSSHTYLFLISHQAQRLPATVLSRCQRLLFPLPAVIDVMPWLKEQVPEPEAAELLLRLANGAPLKAIQCLHEDNSRLRKDLFQALVLLNQKKHDPIQVAAKFQKAELILLIDFMLTWVMDLIRLQVGCDDIINQDYLNSLVALGQQPNMKKHANWMAYLQQARAQLSLGIHLNKQLLLESLLIRWMECC